MNSLEVKKIFLQITCCASKPSVLGPVSCIQRRGISLSSYFLNDVHLSFLMWPQSRSTLTSSALLYQFYFLSPFCKRAGLLCCFSCFLGYISPFCSSHLKEFHFSLLVTHFCILFLVLWLFH